MLKERDAIGSNRNRLLVIQENYYYITKVRTNNFLLYGRDDVFTSNADEIGVLVQYPELNLPSRKRNNNLLKLLPQVSQNINMICQNEQVTLTE